MSNGKSGGVGSVYRRSDGRWVARAYDRDGKAHTFYGKTRAEAIGKRKIAQARLDAGSAAVDSTSRLAVVVEHWITTTLPTSKRKPATVSLYSGLLRRHVLPRIGRTTLATLRPSAVQAMLADLGATLAPSTIRSTYSALRACLDDAVRDGLLATNPVVRVARPSVPHHEAEVLSADDLGRLLAAAKGTRLEALWLLLAATGLRRGEALGLRWSDIDGDVLHVRRTLSGISGIGIVEHEPKTTKSRRTVDLSCQVLAALSAHRARQNVERLAAGEHWTDQDRVFCSPLGVAFDPASANGAFARLARRAGVSGSPHVLRHTAATALIDQGFALPTVSALLGHSSSVVTLSTYAHALPTQRKAASDALGALLDGAV